MDYDFEDKTVIITGGSEGVGAATARKFAEHGANLILVARSKRNLERIAEKLRGKTRVEIVAMDVSDTDACVNLFKKAEFEFGSIDILVNNAGYHERGPVESVSVEDLSAMIDVNLKAPIILCKIAIKYLKQAGGGAIINVASLAGRTPVPRAATYSATKFGLRAFTFALGEELRGSDIKLAAVSPGPIDTGFIMSNIDDVTDITFSQPMSTAEEVAQEILNLTANKKRERSMPPISGLLTTTVYLFPGLGRLVLPFMIRKGRNVKRKLKARIRQMEEEQGG
jgi:short-subunit dehydrogenase